MALPAEAGVSTDITGGQSVGCNGVNGQTGAPVNGGGVIPYATWNATKGWDPVTGLGVPDFQALLKASALSGVFDGRFVGIDALHKSGVLGHELFDGTIFDEEESHDL